MTGKRVLVTVVFTLVLMTTFITIVDRSRAAPEVVLGTAFTYQGRLQLADGLVNDLCDFQFSLWDADVGGAQVGSTVTAVNITVSEGLFTIPVDFGADMFTGDGRWLAISVRCPAGSGSYTPLSPRQPLTAAPYAQALPGLYTQQTAASPNLIGGYSGNSVSANVAGAVIGGGGSNGITNRITDNFSVVGGGYNNQAGDNAGTTQDAAYNFIGGGGSNTANGNYAVVAGGWGHTASRDFTTIGGGESNTGSADWSTISGGRDNTTSGIGYSTVSGGWNNSASGYVAVISGGNNNTASGDRAIVGGGYNNSATNTYATISGGNNHTANAINTTIGGGWTNQAVSAYGTIPGGSKARTGHYGELAYASGEFATIGDAQTSLYVLRNTTTDATPTALFLDGTAERLTIAQGRVMAFDILIVASGPTGGNIAGYQIQGLVQNFNGTIFFVGVPTVTVLGEDNAAWDTAVAANNTNDALDILVTGAAGVTVRWVASVRTVELLYP